MGLLGSHMDEFQGPHTSFVNSDCYGRPNCGWSPHETCTASLLFARRGAAPCGMQAHAYMRQLTLVCREPACMPSACDADGPAWKAPGSPHMCARQLGGLAMAAACASGAHTADRVRSCPVPAHGKRLPCQHPDRHVPPVCACTRAGMRHAGCRLTLFRRTHTNTLRGCPRAPHASLIAKGCCHTLSVVHAHNLSYAHGGLITARRAAA